MSLFLKRTPIRILSAQFTSPTTRKATMEKISTTDAAPPAGPYTQAIKTTPYIYVSGQIPADKEGNLVKGSIAEQTTASCESVKAILAAAGSSIDKVVKATVFLTDMANFAEMNGVYEKYFAHKPARSCIAVYQLPKGVPVEIEVIALS
ncbi:hypothetical protein KVT40_008546 [Elsinoe batatas]|uniref:YjgF-like protein n=1 Tax=Elsinoe batatas TaxID=2601811 RepID=A0A8K0KUK1_9PEZI|nr:hypothetical protein KVT40_008546 [Elsinoe batatas]